MQAEPTSSPNGASREPWPWIIATCVVLMMMISLTFAWIANRYPDPVIVDERYEVDAKSFSPRRVDGEPLR